MQESANPFSGFAADIQLIHEEPVAAEFEAVQQYMPLAESIDTKPAREVLMDNAGEERVEEVRKPCESRDEGN